VEKNKLKLYPSPNGPDTKIDENPFYSRKVPIRPFGDESFCFEWTAFAPTVVYRVTNIIVNVSARIVVPSRNVSYHDGATFEHTLDVAKHQEAKIRSLMGSAVFLCPANKPSQRASCWLMSAPRRKRGMLNPVRIRQRFR